MKEISWEDFEQIELRIGSIVEVNDFPEAKKPAYQIKVDFGSKIGLKQSSAQITTLYTKEELIGKQIIGVINFPKKQIGPFISEFLITGFYDENNSVVLAVPDKKIANGEKIC